MASSKEAVAQNGEQASSKVKLEGEALKDAIKKQVGLRMSVCRWACARGRGSRGAAMAHSVLHFSASPPICVHACRHTMPSHHAEPVNSKWM
jgi:hypothetical protein